MSCTSAARRSLTVTDTAAGAEPIERTPQASVTAVRRPQQPRPAAPQLPRQQSAAPGPALQSLQASLQGSKLASGPLGATLQAFSMESVKGHKHKTSMLTGDDELGGSFFQLQVLPPGPSRLLPVRLHSRPQTDR